jgi:endonuclease/exonuclease/phosphatase family metal-dependent hydrolase
LLKRAVHDVQAADPGAAVVIAADMNADTIAADDIPEGMVDVWVAQHSAELGMRAGVQETLLEKHNGHTWPADLAKPPTSTLDHILTLGKQFHGCWLSSIQTLVSDHYPLLLECTAS